MFPFGRAFTYNFYALVDDQFEDLSAVDAPEAVYVYDAKPGRDDETRAGTSAWHTAHLIQSVAAWSDITDGKAIAITAIEDPAPAGTQDHRTYWIAIHFAYTVGGQVQSFIRALPMVRAQAWHKTISTSRDDLQSVFPEIDAYISDAKQEAGIALAKRVIEMEFEASGFEWALIWDVDRLKIAVAYRAVSDLLFSLKQAEWVEMARGYREASDDMLKTIRLAYDANKEQEPTTQEARSNFLRITV
jgi:hypothetical protein